MIKFFREGLINLDFFLNYKFKRKFFFIFILTIVASVVELIGVASLPLLVGAFFGNLENQILSKLQSVTKFENTLVTISIIVLLIFILKNLFLSLVYFIEEKFRKDLNIFLKDKVYSGYLTLKYKFFLNDNPSTFTRNILDDTENVNWYFNVLIIFLRETITVLFIASYLVFTDYKTTLSLLIFFSGISFLFYFSLKYKITKFSKNELMLRRYQLKTLTQTFETIEIIKILNKYDFFKKKFNEYTTLKEKYNLYINYLNRLPRLVLELSAIFAIVYVVFLFTMNDFTNKDFIPYLTLLVICIVRFIPAFTSITNSIVIIRKVNVSVERLKELIILINKNKTEVSNNSNLKYNTYPKENNIEIKNLNFSYTQNKEIIKDLSLKIVESDNIALVGSSGNGKSTLVKILLGLLEPTSGEIKYNSMNIQKDIKSWHKKIGYIPQKIYLHDESIKNNIAFGVNEKEIDYEKLKEVIKQVNLEELIDNLPDGIETNVGNQGSNISGGQLQRIGIARVLYASPEILIMDEATNSLDEETEKKVIESINSVDQIKIKIIISHRQSTVNSCNKIYFLDKGNIKKIR